MDLLFTDVANAATFADSEGHRFRWIETLRTWLVWNGKRWEPDTHGAAMEAAKELARRLLLEASEIDDLELRKRAVRDALAVQSANRLESLLKLARSEPGIPIDPGDLDADPWLLNVANGTIDLRTGELLPHDPGRLITKLAPVVYDPDAAAPKWGAFLRQVLPDDDLLEYVARAMGYSLTGLTIEQALFFLCGIGGNGKSTLVDTYARVIGDYARQAEPELLLARRDPHPTGEADLHGARFVVASEADHGRRLAESLVKRHTGDATIKARYMARDFFEFTPSHKLWLLANHKPVVHGTDHGIWRRIKVIPFTVVISDEDRRRDLPALLHAEAPGILAWAVDACRRWQQCGLHEPLAVQLATADYRASMDHVGAFISDSCLLHDDSRTPASALYDAYTRWCNDNGEHPVPQRDLGAALTERGLDRRRHGSSRRWHWFGIGLMHTGVNP